jgi:hypothetical protein
LSARREALIRLRGLADDFEKEDPAVHKANTVDYAIVYDGEIWLELDDGKTIHLKKGDVVVQNGTRHPWPKNRGPDLVYVARVRSGFVPATRRQVVAKLQPLESPFVNLPEAEEGRWGTGLTT